MLGGSAGVLAPMFLFEPQSSLSQQYGSREKGYSGQGRDESEVPMGSWAGQHHFSRLMNCDL